MMNTHSDQASLYSAARWAGILYLIIIVCGLGAELFVRANLVVPDNAAATAENITANLGLYRLGFLADTLMVLSDVALAMLLYVLMAPAGRALALVASGFRLGQAFLLGGNLLLFSAPLLLLGNSAYESGLGQSGTQSLALAFLNMHSYGYDMALLFFGVHCVLLAILMLRSEFFPWLLALLVCAAGLTYLVGSYVRFLAPDYSETIQPIYGIAIVAEVSLCVFLILKGSRLIK